MTSKLFRILAFLFVLFFAGLHTLFAASSDSDKALKYQGQRVMGWCCSEGKVMPMDEAGCVKKLRGQYYKTQDEAERACSGRTEKKSPLQKSPVKKSVQPVLMKPPKSEKPHQEKGISKEEEPARSGSYLSLTDLFEKDGELHLTLKNTGPRGLSPSQMARGMVEIDTGKQKMTYPLSMVYKGMGSSGKPGEVVVFASGIKTFDPMKAKASIRRIPGDTDLRIRMAAVGKPHTMRTMADKEMKGATRLMTKSPVAEVKKKGLPHSRGPGLMRKELHLTGIRVYSPSNGAEIVSGLPFNIRYACEDCETGDITFTLKSPDGRSVATATDHYEVRQPKVSKDGSAIEDTSGPESASAVRELGRTFSWTLPGTLRTGPGYSITISHGSAEVRGAIHDISLKSRVKVTTPNGGENWGRGSVQKVRWESLGGPGYINTHWSVDIIKKGSIVFTDSASGMGCLVTGESITPPPHQPLLQLKQIWEYDWFIPNDLGADSSREEHYLAEVSSSDGAISDAGDNSFTLRNRTVSDTNMLVRAMWVPQMDGTIALNVLTTCDPGVCSRGGRINYNLASTPAGILYSNTLDYPAGEDCNQSLTWDMPGGELPEGYSYIVTAFDGACWGQSESFTRYERHVVGTLVIEGDITFLTPYGYAGSADHALQWYRGNRHRIEWQDYVNWETPEAYYGLDASLEGSCGGDTRTVKVVRQSGGSSGVHHTFSTSDVHRQPGSSRCYIDWNIPASTPTAGTYHIEIEDNLNTDGRRTFNSRDFVVREGGYELTAPSTGRTYYITNNLLVQWDEIGAGGSGGFTGLFLQNPERSYTLTSSTDLDSGFFSWRIVDVEPGEYRLRMTAGEQFSGPFRIAYPTLSLLEPRSEGHAYSRETPIRVSWNTEGMVLGTSLNLELVYPDGHRELMDTVRQEEGHVLWSVGDDIPSDSDYRFRLSYPDCGPCVAESTRFAITGDVEVSTEEGGEEGDCTAGEPCMVRPRPWCINRPDFEVEGVTVCEGGVERCVAFPYPAGDDFCSIAGGVCGRAEGAECNLDHPCAPGMICAPVIGSDMGRCTVGHCDIPPGFCWTVDEVGEAHLVCGELYGTGD